MNKPDMNTPNSSYHSNISNNNKQDNDYNYMNNIQTHQYPKSIHNSDWKRPVR